jgi:hypothetical protein
MLGARTRIAALVPFVRPGVIRAAWWAFGAMKDVRRQLAAGVASPSVAGPPALPLRVGLGVDAVIGRMGATCLEGAMVRQRWLAAHGDLRDVVIGLPPSDFGPTPAHAWVDGLDPAGSDLHAELYRIPAQA